MNFFRLRVINTFLLFLIGIVMGFILKDKFYPAMQTPARPAYQPSFTPRAETQQPAQPEAEEPVDEPYTAPEAEPEPEPRKKRASSVREGSEGQYSSSSMSLSEDGSEGQYSSSSMPLSRDKTPRPALEAVVIEAAPAAEEGRGAGRPPVKGTPGEFFKNPAAFEGRELEMELQMITAKKSQRGWRVNLVYTSPEKETDYLYLDDTEVLGEKPDLRIGYVYRVRFLAVKGDASSGNTLLSISATGEKAAWATGLSAVE